MESSASERDLEDLLHECMVPCIEPCMFEDLDSGLALAGNSSPGSAHSPAHSSQDPALRQFAGLQHTPALCLQPGVGGAPPADALSRTATTPAQPRDTPSFNMLAPSSQQQHATQGVIQWPSTRQQASSSSALSRALSEPQGAATQGPSQAAPAAPSLWFGRSREEPSFINMQQGARSVGQVSMDGSSSAASHPQLLQQAPGPQSAGQLGGSRSASLDYPRPQSSNNLPPVPRLSAQHSSTGGAAGTAGMAAYSMTPDPTSVSTTSVVGIPKEQYQLLLGSASSAPTSAATNVVTSTSPAAQLEQAEALWQGVAASGADDQTLLNLASSLGLIVSDSTGNMLLTRELTQVNNSAPNATGLYSLLDSSSLAAAAAAQSGVQDASAVSQSALVTNLLRAYGGLRMPLSAPGTKPQGSPGPGPSKQHTLYKTELCRGWLESGTCRYGSKCQFAHGREELRPVPRHPKYKTEVCRSFTATGVCAYGPRCRFIHGCASEPMNAIDSGAVHKLLDAQDTLDGVFGFDSPSPTQQQDALNRSLNHHHSVLAALAGPLALRQAAQAAQQQQQSLLASMTATNQEAADTLTRRNLLASLASLAGQQRTSFDSALTRGRSSLSGLDLPQRSCLSDMQRSSLESRGRTSFESAQSQQDWSQSQGLTAEALAGYMPGIPEYAAMPYMPNEQWPGTAPAGSASAAATNNPFSFRAPSPAALLRQFPGPPRSVSARNSAEILRLPASGPSVVGAPWWANTTTTSAVPTDLDMQTSLLSAYSSGLYSASANSKMVSGGVRMSAPGVVTPEASEAGAGLHSSDMNIMHSSGNIIM